MNASMHSAGRVLASLLAAALALTPSMRAAAEDIDLFVGGTNSAQNANILIIMDNSANWAAQSQHWPGGIFQGQAELRSLKVLLDSFNKGFNMGLMMLTPGVGTEDGWQNRDGAFIRFAIRDMGVEENRKAFQELIGDEKCVDGPNSLVKSTRNCIFKNATASGGGGSLGEGIGSNVDYSATMFEAYKYFGGYSTPALAQKDTAGGAESRSTFGPLRYSGNSDPGGDSGSYEDRYDSAAYTDPESDYSSAHKRARYNPPISVANSCARNYIIFIGNGFPVQDSPASLLTGVGGNATQLSMPQFNTTTTATPTTLGVRNVCESVNACVSYASSNFPGYDSYSCSGGTTSATFALGTRPAGTCETAAACAAVAAASFSGYSSYSCTGGTAGTVSTTTALQTTGTTCESAASCAARAATIYGTQYDSYSCTGGNTTTAGTSNLGSPTAVCETASTCATRAATLFPGYASYSCTGGSSSSATVTLEASTTSCETATACRQRGEGIYGSTYNTISCSGGTTTGCSGSARVGQTMTGQNVCTGQNLVGQQMTGTTAGCTAPNLVNQTMQGTRSTACFSGQTMQGTLSCSGNAVVGQTMVGTTNVVTVTPTQITAVPGSNVARYADEWAKYLYTTDVSDAPGQQYVTTYTIDVFKDAQDARQTALLYNMAQVGGGKYFRATSEQEIEDALAQILIEIQSQNSVFASASLPINATNRSQNENQVFIGMFRPDAKARPRWYGNLKRYQIGKPQGEIALVDADEVEALDTVSGFIQPCARSFWTTDSGNYWDFSTGSVGTCAKAGVNLFSDMPDGQIVEKGSIAEVVRKGNNPPTTNATPTWTENRSVYTCRNTGGSVNCSSLVALNTTNVDASAVGAADATAHARIVNFTRGVDVNDENTNTLYNDVRPSVHGDVVHSRPLPVNYAAGTGVVVYYGANDGTFRAVRASDGKELWAFVAPEHHAKLSRLLDNSPQILYPTTPDGVVPTPTAKDYFFDGSTGLYQNADNTAIWIYTSQRRGGRMLYGFDVSNPAVPGLLWRLGCPNPSNDTGCTSGMSNIGQTWSLPNVARVKGYDADIPLVITGGGHDSCDDKDDKSPECGNAKGRGVYVINGKDGSIVRAFGVDDNTGTVLTNGTVLRSVVSDITLIDRDFDAYVDHGYVGDTGGNIYRIDFVNPVTLAVLKPEDWTITRIAYTNTGNGANYQGRKFLFPPGVLPGKDLAYVAITSGDRERPLISNYPYTSPVVNRAYMFIDKFTSPTVPINLDDTSANGPMSDYTTDSGCSATNITAAGSKEGWLFDLNASTGEQGVTSSLIFGGLVFFSTNYPIPPKPGVCTSNLGEARGYAVNLLNASGAAGTQNACGGDRSSVFIGGGLPPSPVAGVVPVDGKMENILIGVTPRPSGPALQIGAQKGTPSITLKRKRVYWYRSGDQ